MEQSKRGFENSGATVAEPSPKRIRTSNNNGLDPENLMDLDRVRPVQKEKTRQKRHDKESVTALWQRCQEVYDLLRQDNPDTALRVEHQYNNAREQFESLESTKVKVVLFGAQGAGKSMLINLLVTGTTETYPLPSGNHYRSITSTICRVSRVESETYKVTAHFEEDNETREFVSLEDVNKELQRLFLENPVSVDITGPFNIPTNVTIVDTPGKTRAVAELLKQELSNADAIIIRTSRTFADTDFEDLLNYRTFTVDKIPVIISTFNDASSDAANADSRVHKDAAEHVQQAIDKICDIDPSKLSKDKITTIDRLRIFDQLAESAEALAVPGFLDNHERRFNWLQRVYEKSLISQLEIVTRYASNFLYHVQILVRGPKRGRPTPIPSVDINETGINHAVPETTYFISENVSKYCESLFKVDLERVAERGDLFIALTADQVKQKVLTLGDEYLLNLLEKMKYYGESDQFEQYLREALDQCIHEDTFWEEFDQALGHVQRKFRQKLRGYFEDPDNHRVVQDNLITYCEEDDDKREDGQIRSASFDNFVEGLSAMILRHCLHVNDIETVRNRSNFIRETLNDAAKAFFTPADPHLPLQPHVVESIRDILNESFTIIKDFVLPRRSVTLTALDPLPIIPSQDQIINDLESYFQSAKPSTVTKKIDASWRDLDKGIRLTMEDDNEDIEDVPSISVVIDRENKSVECKRNRSARALCVDYSEKSHQPNPPPKHVTIDPVFTYHYDSSIHKLADLTLLTKWRQVEENVNNLMFVLVNARDKGECAKKINNPPELEMFHKHTNVILVSVDVADKDRSRDEGDFKMSDNQAMVLCDALAKALKNELKIDNYWMAAPTVQALQELSVNSMATRKCVFSRALHHSQLVLAAYMKAIKTRYEKKLLDLLKSRDLLRQLNRLHHSEGLEDQFMDVLRDPQKVLTDTDCAAAMARVLDLIPDDSSEEMLKLKQHWTNKEIDTKFIHCLSIPMELYVSRTVLSTSQLYTLTTRNQFIGSLLALNIIEDRPSYSCQTFFNNHVTNPKDTTLSRRYQDIVYSSNEVLLRCEKKVQLKTFRFGVTYNERKQTQVVVF